MSSNVIQQVKDALDVHNVGPHILEKVPSLTRRAIFNLQRNEALPPRNFDFLSGDKKEEKRDDNGELLYHFYRLPSDFRKLSELYVHDQKSADASVVPYTYTRYENYLEHISNHANNWFRRTLEDKNEDFHEGRKLSRSHPFRKVFTIKYENNFDDSDNVAIMMLHPFPEDDIYVRIEYHVDGSETSIDQYDGEYTEAIIKQVESLLGLRSSQEAEEESLNSASWKESKGANKINKTVGKVKPTLFGKWHNRR